MPRSKGKRDPVGPNQFNIEGLKIRDDDDNQNEAPAADGEVYQRPEPEPALPPGDSAPRPSDSPIVNRNGRLPQGPRDKPKRGRQTAAPICPTCHVPCVAGSSSPVFTRYYCPNTKDRTCASNYKPKVPRPEVNRGWNPPEEPEDFSAR